MHVRHISELSPSCIFYMIQHKGLLLARYTVLK